MRKSLSKIVILFILICLSMIISGCWDYSEMHDIKFAAGMAVDKDESANEYTLTIEVLKAASDGKNMESTIVQSRGKTIFTALRDAIKKTGKPLQVSHMKVVIVSEDIANEGIIPVLDLINRDIEVRNDMWILISQTNTASEIFTKYKNKEGIMSYELADTIGNYNKIGKYIPIEVFKLIDCLSAKGISATVPIINTDTKDEKTTIKVSGTAVFKDDKMIGQLNENETLILELLKEKKLKFVIPIIIEKNKRISLEMMNINRKINPKIEGNKISIDMYIDMDVALAELAETGEDYVSKKQRVKLKEQSEKYIENSAYKLIEKLQKQYKSDVIGFGEILSKRKPNEWRKVSNNWNEVFEYIDINVFVTINIKYSGATNKNIEVSD